MTLYYRYKHWSTGIGWAKAKGTESFSVERHGIEFIFSTEEVPVSAYPGWRWRV